MINWIRDKMIGITKPMIVSIIFILISIQVAHSMPTLQLSDGSTTIMVVDEGPNDALIGIIGGVGYLGPVGYFNLNVTTGFVTPFLGTSSFPVMNLNSVDVSSSQGGGTLTIMFTATDFLPSGASVFESKVGGTTRGATSFNTYIDSTNAAFGTETLIGSFGTYGSGAFNGSNTVTLSIFNPYSITTVATINHGSGNKVSSFGLNVNVVPEPVSSALFVIGGVMLVSRFYLKRKNQHASKQAIMDRERALFLYK